MCGHVRYGRLVLTAAATRQELRFNVDAQVNRTLLGRIVGDDVRYVGDPQFTVTRCAERCSWIINHSPAALNATVLNAEKIAPEGARLTDGDEIAVGTNKAKLSVRIEL